MSAVDLVWHRSFRRRASGLPPLLLLAAFLAGCGGGGEGFFQHSLGVEPQTIMAGTPIKLEPGWGGEYALQLRGGEDFEEFGVQLRFAWSHHPDGPGQPAAEYVRLVPALVYTKSVSRSAGVSVALGLGSWNFLATDGPGDRGGFGVSLEPELWLATGRFRLSLGCAAEGWVSMSGDLVGALAPYLRLGLIF